MVRRIGIYKSPSGRGNALPLLSVISFKDTSRLIPSKYSIDEESALTRLAPDTKTLHDGFQVESRTNDRLIADVGGLPGITPHELVANVPYASIINAAFTHPRPEGSRFNGPGRGAWYAAKSVRTAQAEVAHHQTVALAEIGRYEDEVTYDEYLADFAGDLHNLLNSPEFAASARPGELQGITAACSGVAGDGVIGNRLSQRSRQRYLHSLLPTGAGDTRSERQHIQVSLGRNSKAQH